MAPSEFDYVNSYRVSEVAAFGCHHSELAGLSPSDVHILDLDSADGFASDPSDPAPVYLSLAPEEEESGQVSRNLTLLLSSREPVQWMLQSRLLSGKLRVLFVGPAGSRVEDFQLASLQHLEARRLRLDDASFEGLWRAAAHETGGTAMAYVKLKKANIISLVVAKAAVGGERREEKRKCDEKVKVQYADDVHVPIPYIYVCF